MQNDSGRLILGFVKGSRRNSRCPSFIFIGKYKLPRASYTVFNLIGIYFNWLLNLKDSYYNNLRHFNYDAWICAVG